MSAAPTSPLPIALKVGGSVFAVGHLVLIGLYALAAMSGPWPVNNGTDTSPGPQFASAIVWNGAYGAYLAPLRLSNDYHFASNRPAEFAVYFEVQLKYETGEVKTLKFPDEKANAWVRHRQQLLAQQLAQDVPLPPRGPSMLDVPGENTPTVDIWVPDGELVLRLTAKSENDKMLRQPGILQPTERAKLLANAFTRYLCKEHGAVSAHLTRYSRRAVIPMDMYSTIPEIAQIRPLPPDFFSELKSHFGEYRRDK